MEDRIVPSYPSFFVSLCVGGEDVSAKKVCVCVKCQSVPRASGFCVAEFRELRTEKPVDHPFNAFADRMSGRRRERREVARA